MSGNNKLLRLTSQLLAHKSACLQTATATHGTNDPTNQFCNIDTPIPRRYVSSTTAPASKIIADAANSHQALSSAKQVNRTSSSSFIHKQFTYPHRRVASAASRVELQLTTVNEPKAKYGGRFMVTLLPGDGIGPEMMRHVKTIFAVAGVPVDFEEINLDSMNENISKVEEAITSIKRNGIALKGNIETRDHSKYFKSRNVELRTRLNLFANLVHIRSQPGVQTRHKDIDLVLIRQNTEGEYSSIEHETVPGVVSCLKVVTRHKSDQIARYAFNFALQNNRKKISCVHKANIMKVSDGLFLKVAREVAKEYPEIEFEDIIIDNCSMQLVSNPWQFDVLLLPNLYGAVLTNIACGLVGGPGLTSGVNFGDEFAVFETGARNTGKAMVGKNTANPLAVINASADLLQHLKLYEHASLLRDAINSALNEAQVHTPDLGGHYTTTDVVNHITDYIRQQSLY